MALVPFPPSTATVGEKTALECLKAAVRGATVKGVEIPDDALTRTARACSAVIQRYAAPKYHETENPHGTPQDVLDEALVRYVAYQVDTIGAERLSKQSILIPSAKLSGETPFPESTLLPAPTNSQAAFLYSGAKGLLSPWKVRRAGAV